MGLLDWFRRRRKMSPLTNRQKSDIFNATELLKAITDNDELSSLELEGFIRREEKGKTIGVSLDTLRHSLRKQQADYDSTWIDFILGNATIADLKRCIADIRNVAGCIFLVLDSKKRVGVKQRNVKGKSRADGTDSMKEAKEGRRGRVLWKKVP